MPNAIAGHAHENENVILSFVLLNSTLRRVTFSPVSQSFKFLVIVHSHFHLSQKLKAANAKTNLYYTEF